jgi:uncharacterized membrane protein YdcZ (DUF606 family)
MMALLIGTGLIRLLTGTLPEHASQFPAPPVQETLGFAYVFLLLKAFASGGAAVTGVEAISNGVPAFRPPEWRNARTTLMWMGGILGTLFLFLSIFAAHMHIGVDPEETVTVIAQIAKAIFGSEGPGPVLFAALQIATLLILVLAANTSFADFPRLASFHAGDHFLPRQLTRYGDRLVFSNGIIVLSVLASILVIVFDASVSRLIPLYAIGVFTSFTFSQLGMAKHHLVKREPGWRLGLAINGLGGVVTAVVSLIIAAVKFKEGAYIVLIAIPLVLFGLLRVNRHYRQAGESLRDPARRSRTRELPRQIVVIPVGAPGREDVYAAAYASRVWPIEARMVHFADQGASLADVVASLGGFGLTIDLIQQRKGLIDDLLRHVRSVRDEAGPDAVVNVVVPETVTHRRVTHVLRNWRVQRLKAALVAEARVVVTNVTYHPGYEALEPVAATETPTQALKGWRHVAVVLVADVNNATDRSLRYARSLRADELHCMHISIDRHDTTRLQEEWESRDPGAPLEVLESPFRQIARPLHDWVRGVLEERPRTFVTLVIPEFVVAKRWHSALHNQTSLALKGAFLFEPSVVVSAVPYKLDR